MRNISNNNQRGSIHFILLAIVVIVIIGAIGFLFWNNFIKHDQKAATVQGVPSNSESASNQNIELMNKADEFLDTKYCDQIKGSINYTNPNENRHTGGISGGVAVITPAMTESEAKASCRNHVQQLIAQKNYENKVCADKDVTYYEFNNVKWPCPDQTSLHIPELGIELTAIPGSISDLVYKIGTSGTAHTAAFSTTSLRQLAPSCSIGTIAKIDINDTNPQYQLVKQYSAFNFWIGYQKSQSSCSNDKNIESLYKAQASKFESLATTKGNVFISN